MRRSERLGLIMQQLLESPGTMFSLGDFAQAYGVAKSSASEDLAVIRQLFETTGTGVIETFSGASGGVRYLPLRDRDTLRGWALELCRELSDPERVLPGGFIYMTDILFQPRWALRIGIMFASLFYEREAQFVATVETKGIPLALMTGHALNLPVALVRKNLRASEGSSVTTNYFSGAAQRIQTMSLPRRALPPNSRVLVVDDFMRGGGTAAGMMELLRECQAQVAGIGVLIATTEPVSKRVDDFIALLQMEGNLAAGRFHLRPGTWLERS